MMKKIAAVFGAAMLALSANAYAEETIKVEKISFSPVNSSLTVSGTCTGAKDNLQLLEQISDASGKVVASSQTAVKDGKFSVDGFLLPESLPVGDYTINLSLMGGANITVDNAFYYGGRDEAKDILNQIDQAASTGAIDTILTTGDNNKILGFNDYDIYKKCFSKSRLLAEFVDMDLAVDDTNLTAKWTDFLTRLQKNTLLTYFSDTKSAADIKMLIETDEYFNAMGMTESETYTWLTEEGKKKAYEFIAEDAADTLEGSVTLYKKGCLLAYLKICRYSDIEKAFKANADIITVDYQNYNLLSESNKSSVLNTTMTYIQSSNDISAIVKYFEAQALAYLLKNDGGSTGGGSTGGGYSNYGGANKSDYGSGGVQNGAYDGYSGYFADLEEVPWAFEAVTALANRGVVSGKGGASFAPNDNVTRAEFCKMVCICFGLYTEGESSFADVAADSWYHIYVTSLANAGIINGTGDNCFSPDSFITRQDIAVILMRLIDKYGYQIPTLGENTVFADDAQIPEYAKESMYMLNSYGILTGSEGSALPADNATRAQAAVLIYRTEVARW